MFDLKKRVILITYLGLIPFYFNTLVDFFGLENLLHQKFNLKQIHTDRTDDIKMVKYLWNFFYDNSKEI